MKILFIVPSYKPAYIYGGPIVVVALLAEQLVKLGHEVNVYTTTANGQTELNLEAGKPIIVDGVNVTYFKRVTKDHTHASPDLWKLLNNTIKDFDVIHIHSWWNLLVIGAAWVCKRHNIKPVISPHGMFSDYILETNNSTKKRWIHKFIGKRLLTNSLLHVSTAMEWSESKKIIPSWEGMVIPNLVKLADRKFTRKVNDVFTIGFLSRIDPKKGIDILIRALSKVNFKYKLKVAGSGKQEYVESLKGLARECGNEHNIEWVGWKDTEAKFEFLAGVDLFALTSHSENFAIVVIESLSVGTPVIVSDQVGLNVYVKDKSYGWVTTMDIQVIAEQLNVTAASRNKLAELNTTLPDLIQKEYEPGNLAQQYVGLYEFAIQTNNK
ncbi:glycosyltransferase [Mucilaginibacter sp. Bleaf8]|uniref:XrtY-associated glycosyltransferase XYAG1 n=1 Tax=Mucilaginibacter sp. Bleaf8 TaxID=2834430 RepID=UPI001BD0CAF9|nr:glycosyltransferase [Mucilaginibacter sp. Bleaf8]MBS7566463.1 glycosyltransferase [Mucilaginibacter sp. Bleaf8]